MAERLVEQLVDAGLVTEAQARAGDGGDALLPSGRVAQNLVAAGLDERVLAGFFVSRGFGPMLQAQELARADEELAHRLPAAAARDLCALPLRPSPAGAIVAMADPSDRRAVAELTEVLGGGILPTVAKLSDLLAAIDRIYPTERPAIGTDETPSDFDPGLSGLPSTASPVWDRAWNRSPIEAANSSTPQPSHAPLPIVSRPPTTSPSSVRPVSVQASMAAASGAAASGIEAHLAELNRVTSRDDVVRVACHACLTVARGAAFLALRKGVFRGWDGAGEEVTSAGIRSLWVPASNPSMLNEVLHSGRAFHGAYGQTAADHLFRAAFGSQGRDVVIVPVMIGSRMVGVLCANEPSADTSVVERVAEATGQAFERLIVSHKSGG